MIVHGGVHGDVSSARLPADAYPAIFAYSLNRKLRKLYTGQYFRYRQTSGGEYDYPENTPNLTEDVFVVKIYDQKLKHGVPVQDAVQAVENLQPRLVLNSSTYSAEFDQAEYFDIPDLASFIGEDFTLTAIGDGDTVPRPMIGIWSSTDIVTLEPSDLITRFCFNSNMGAVLKQDGTVMQCFSGYEWRQNYTRIMSIKTASETAYRSRADRPNAAFQNLSIGRQGGRSYKGTFTEAVMHSNNLTELGSEQLFTTTRTHYGY
jgi:hypothetical protein